MLRIWTVFLAVIFAGPGFALGPAELPPPDFTAPQYIDSKGCVFIRKEDGGWAPRLYRDGSLVCGYPPSLSARRLTPEGGARLFSDSNPAPFRSDQIERALTQLVIPNLQTGELVGERAPLTPLPDMGPEPASQEPAQMLSAEIKAQPRLRAEMGRSLQPNRQLCQLLNYGAPEVSAQGLGHDPTEGFCDGLSRPQLAQLAFVRPANLPVTTKVTAAGPVASDNIPEMAAPRGEAKDQPKLRAEKTTAHQNKTEVSRREADSFQMPRFIRIGSFPSEQQMLVVAGQVAAMQFPVVRPKSGQSKDRQFILLAGPFEERQALVIALDRIRRAGFPSAAPF